MRMEWSNQKEMYIPLHAIIMENCKFEDMNCKVGYMWSDLMAENKPQATHTDFDPNIAHASMSKPMIVFTPISHQRSILLV